MEATSPRRRPRVLIVEDEDDARELYLWCMRAAGWMAAGAVDGAEAITRAIEFEPDAIVMDLHLPIVDGLEAVRCLKQDERTKHIVIVACTAFGRAGGPAEDAARAAGCDDFVAKPCEPDALRGVIEALVAGRGGGSYA